MARAGDYARAGVASTKNTLNTLAAVRDNSPKYDEIQTEGMRQRAKIKIAGLKAEGEVARAAINAEAKIRQTKAKIDGDNAVREGKRNVAKAGVVAAAGQLIGDAFKKPGPDPMKPFQPDRSATEQLLAETGAKLQSDIDSLNDKITSMKDGTYDYGFDDEPSSSKPDTGAITTPDTGAITTPDGKKPWQALSTVIRSVEGTLGDKGYTTRFGGHQFSDMSQHPNIAAPTPWGTKSEAAGAYQFMKPTWDEAAAALGLTDFSRESQEKAGRFLTQRRGVKTDTVFTTFEEFSDAISKLSPEWAGLPNSTNGRSGYHGQANADMNELWQLYQQNL